MQPRLEDSSDGPFSEDECVQSDKSESEGEQLMITGESSTPTASAPLTHATEDPEIDKAIAHETEASLCHESLLESTATENLFASNEMAADAFTLDAAPTRSGRQRRMRDMAGVHACICGSVISEEAKKALL